MSTFSPRKSTRKTNKPAESELTTDVEIDAAVDELSEQFPLINIFNTLYSVLMITEKTSAARAMWEPLARMGKRWHFIPVHHSTTVGHWSLLVGDVESRHFVHVDPSASTDGKRDCRELLKLSPNFRKFTLVDPVYHTEQTDAVSCGKFVIKYMKIAAEYISQQEALPTVFDTEF